MSNGDMPGEQQPTDQAQTQAKDQVEKQRQSEQPEKTSDYEVAMAARRQQSQGKRAEGQSEQKQRSDQASTASEFEVAMAARSRATEKAKDAKSGSKPSPDASSLPKGEEKDSRSQKTLPASQTDKVKPTTQPDGAKGEKQLEKKVETDSTTGQNFSRPPDAAAWDKTEKSQKGDKTVRGGRETTHHDGLDAAEKGLDTAEKIHKIAGSAIAGILKLTGEYKPEAIEMLERYGTFTEGWLGTGESVLGIAKNVSTLRDQGATKEAKLEAGISLVSNGLKGQKSALSLAEALGVISKVPAAAESLGALGTAIDGTWKITKWSLEQGADFMGAAVTMDVQQAYRKLNENGEKLWQATSEANAIQEVMETDPHAAKALEPRLQGAISKWHNALEETAGDFATRTSKGDFTGSASALDPSHYRAVFDQLPFSQAALETAQGRNDVASLNSATVIMMSAISQANSRVSDALEQHKGEVPRARR